MVTECAQDLTQHLLDTNVDLPLHLFEANMNIQHVLLWARTNALSKLLQVYVNNFCYASTESKDGSHIPRICRASIHGIHMFFPQPVVTSQVDGKKPISKTKRNLGNENFTSAKEMIGFMFDGIKRIVCLPPAKAVAYIKEMHWILHCRSVPLKDLQTLVGRLKHMSIILPAAQGFFPTFNKAMQGGLKIIGPGKLSDIRATLSDLCSLICIFGLHPTSFGRLSSTFHIM
jgi:hypothetical protein